jgi:hypothetical protein
MTDTPQSDNEMHSKPQPGKVASPKRGAIPSPKADIEKAKPYIPKTDQEGGESGTVSPQSEEVDHEKGSREEDDHNP